jgi:L-cysteine:1D-myo-inositol 2-amino-2-deoxy-alpha-D-glucopyranoside ligase
VLDRPWSQPWEYRPELLETASARLDELFAAAGRPGSSPAASRAVVDRLLDDLDVSGALDVALADGGDAARQLVRVLALG